MDSFSVVGGFVNHTIATYWIFEFVRCVYIKINADSRAQMCSPEIGAPVYWIFGFLNYDEVEHGLRSDLSAGKRTDEIHRGHPELGHLVAEAVKTR